MTIPPVKDQISLDYASLDNSLSLADDVGSSKRGTALANKLTNVLSSSYTDSDLRDALRLLDKRGVQDAERTRTNLKYDAQEEVTRANADIIHDFSKVAKQLQRVGSLITILNQTCDEMRAHIQVAKQETFPMLEEASTLLARKEETEFKQQLLDAFKTNFLVSDEDLTTLTNSAEPVNDRYFAVLPRVKQIHKDCEILLGYENQRLGLELMDQTGRNLDAGYKKLYGWIQREFKGLDLEDPRTSGSIRKSLRALSEKPTLFQNCLDLFGEAREVTLRDGFQSALTDSTTGTAKSIEFSTHDPLRYIGDMLAWVHSATISEKEALEGLFVSDADEMSRGLYEGVSSEPWARIHRPGVFNNIGKAEDQNGGPEPAFDGRAALNSLISRNMVSVSQNLQQRIALAIRNLGEPLLIYKAYNLLLFYEDIFVKLLGMNKTRPESSNGVETIEQISKQSHSLVVANDNTLLTAIAVLQSSALDLFKVSLKEDIESQHAVPDASLSPPAVLTAHLKLLSSLLTLRSPNLTTNEFTNLYTAVLTPVLQLCTEMADSLSPEDAAAEHEDNANDTENHDSQDNATFETILFKLNFLQPTAMTFTSLSNDKTLSSFVQAPLQHARREIAAIQSQLADLLTTSFFHDSGLSSLLDFIERAEEAEARTSSKVVKQVRIQLLNNSLLETAATALDKFLASALMDAQDDLARLADKSTAKAVIGQAVEEFCEEFEKVVGWIDELDRQFVVEQEGEGKKQGDDDDVENEEELLLREVYPRTVGEVRALLS